MSQIERRGRIQAANRRSRKLNADGIACWFIDTDYNEECFFVRGLILEVECRPADCYLHRRQDSAQFLSRNEPRRGLWQDENDAVAVWRNAIQCKEGRNGKEGKKGKKTFERDAYVHLFASHFHFSPFPFFLLTRNRFTANG
jgi:hypothetical protein